MRKALLILVVLIPLAAFASDLPTRKAGLWEIETVNDGVSTGQKTKQCVDAKTDAAMMEMGKAISSQMGNCTITDPKKEGDQYVSTSSCSMAGTKMTAKTVFSGNFTTDYVSETNTTFDPPMMGMASSKSKVTGRWVGPCEAGQNPGDIIMPNGQKMNMSNLQGMAHGAAAGGMAGGAH